MAIIDCRFAFRLIENAVNELVGNLRAAQPLSYLFLRELEEVIKKSVNRINLCDYSLTVEGILEEQVGTYLKDSKEMELAIGKAGN